MNKVYNFEVLETTLVTIMDNRKRNIVALLSDSNCNKRRCQRPVNLESRLKRQDTLFKKAINIEKRILVALKSLDDEDLTILISTRETIVLATNMELMNVASLFGTNYCNVKNSSQR
ncbi:hypothetical protein BLOT_006784 [Blomia tropicalis]|nr:hypothetical protein BLOT_006784 [Blomia tropicalis]